MAETSLLKDGLTVENWKRQKQHKTQTINHLYNKINQENN